MNTDPMEQAYKLLSGDPAQDAVSMAAKGRLPETDKQQRMRVIGKTEPGDGAINCMDIEEAYANLFEAIAVIMRHK